MRISSKKILIAVIVLSGVIMLLCCFRGGTKRPPAGENPEDGSAFVPIIMYHGITEKEELRGEYTVSLSELEQDMVYLKNHGFTTVFIDDLIAYVDGEGELPEKPVVLTFDDGAYSNYVYLPPLLEKYDMKAVVSPVGIFTVNASESAEEQSVDYSSMTWAQINELRDSGRVEICSHGYDMHSLDGRRGILQKPGESGEAYQRAVYNDVFAFQQLLEENCGFRPDCYTYPYGFYDEISSRLIKECGFRATLDTEQQPNFIRKGEPLCLYGLGRYNRPSYADTEDFMRKVTAR
ncbi:MAG: polysaccharide deacetylase family protein [Ruminococcus sp.]|nr:polysaccharide deacetylase family protein [Ruminococcus sp.]